MKRMIWLLCSCLYAFDHYELKGKFDDAHIYQYGNLLLIKNMNAKLVQEPSKATKSHLTNISKSDLILTVSPNSYCMVKKTEPMLSINCYDAKDDSGRIHLLLDAGHGGKDSGAISATGLKEKHVTLSYVKKLYKYLEHPLFKLSLTRDKDVYIDKYDRLRKILALQPDIVLSVHADAYVKPSAAGLGLYHLDESQGSLLSQQLIKGYQTEKNMRANSEQFANQILGMLEGEYKLHISKAQGLPLVVLRSPTCVSMLLELGFLSNPEEASYLASENYLEGFAEDVAHHLIEIVTQQEKIIYMAVFD